MRSDFTTTVRIGGNWVAVLHFGSNRSIGSSAKETPVVGFAATEKETPVDNTVEAII